MIVDFVCSNQDVSSGSYRIWIRDVIPVMRNLGVDARIISSVRDIRSKSIVILSKGDVAHRQFIDNSHVVGAINIASNDLTPLDFIICGSVEERLSLLQNNKNVYIVNLIESMYENYALKKHIDSNCLVLGYHGSYTHLAKLEFGFVKAFREVTDEGKSLIFSCVTNEPHKAQEILRVIGMPMERVDSKKWCFDTMPNDLYKMDIGIVPNTTQMESIGAIRNMTSVDAGLYTTDYISRYKNKSNPGRAFVFFQMGIPVITDLTPSNMPMFFDEKAGSLAYTSHSWKSSIQRFLIAEERNLVARFASERFQKLYSKTDDIKILVSGIKEIEGKKSTDEQ